MCPICELELYSYRGCDFSNICQGHTEAEVDTWYLNSLPKTRRDAELKERKIAVRADNYGMRRF